MSILPPTWIYENLTFGAFGSKNGGNFAVRSGSAGRKQGD